MGRKRNYEGFAKLVEDCMQNDKNKTGFLSADVVRTVLHAHHVPLPNDILRAAIAICPANENGEIQYEQLINSMNWRDAPVQAMQYKEISDDPNWSGTRQDKTCVSNINYIAMLDEFFGKKSS